MHYSRGCCHLILIPIGLLLAFPAASQYLVQADEPNLSFVMLLRCPAGGCNCPPADGYQVGLQDTQIVRLTEFLSPGWVSTGISSFRSTPGNHQGRVIPLPSSIYTSPATSCASPALRENGRAAVCARCNVLRVSLGMAELDCFDAYWHSIPPYCVVCPPMGR